MTGFGYNLQPGHLAVNHADTAVKICGRCDVTWSTKEESCWSCGEGFDDQTSTYKAQLKLSSPATVTFNN